ncbi:glutamine-synthetase adenylyltransferase [Ruegeria arenilitoris]|uniref:[protein-PII] uridylyltransferase family protein n=1 Tax=Ruegeria arenilitoris TaxID=1173585 RepID=UPI00147A62BB|nr:glutamine-synthetase adenylyltransferase [Ruegeria arenilitoris]
MNSALSIERLPRAYDVSLGEEIRAALQGLTREQSDLVAGAAGSSPYLKGLIEQDGDWLSEALQGPDMALADVMTAVRDLPSDQLKPGLRLAKRRVALLTALADLAGAWPLEKVTAALTDFGSIAADVAAKTEIEKLIQRGKLPGLSPDDIETAGGMIILAMGKMGAHELNYSSDIDLIVLFDETRFDPDDFYEARHGMVRATRNFCATLSEKTADGYVFRTDLRLRPDPAVTPVCLAMEAAERYYESLGRTWERAAYIKARPCAGDIAAGERFLQALRPFVWRRHLDFAAIQDAHDIRLRIRESKGTGGAILVPGHDMKLGQGGIREIEFFTQTRQLIAGGRDPDLRVRGTVPGLAALAAKGWVPDEVAEKLTDHYRAHREVEHRIQMVHDAQTHKIPQAEDGIERIACLMGVSSSELFSGIKRRLTEVHELTEGFFAPGHSIPTPINTEVEFDKSVLARWPTYPALRSQRARRIFERLRPELLSRLAKTAQPSEALMALDGFLAGLPAGVQLFSLFEANSQLIDLLIDIVGTSHALASYLSRNASVFDAVIVGSFFSDWPGCEVLEAELSQALKNETDYENQLDLARRWSKEWRFRIGVHHLRGLIDSASAGQQYADLAQAVIAAILPVVAAQFATKHGPAPGRGAAVLGMGSLGAGRVNSQSDLDVIVIYDPLDQEMSEGPRPLATRTYYARFTQAFITALSAPMSQGRLYEVDMRLRPSGNQGPVATSWASFTNYQQNDAWVWEHLALTRARVVAGDSELVADIEDFRAEFLSRPRDRRNVLREVAEMRERLAAAKSPSGIWDSKNGAGRMMDIELIAETGALLAGSAKRDVHSGLDGVAAAGLLEVAQGQTLKECYDLCWSLQCAARLLSGEMIEADKIGEGGVAFLCRATGFDEVGQLQAALTNAYDTAAELITAVFEEGKDGTQ